MKSYLFSSEAVAEGHSDKICDQLSDALVDFYLRQDKNARVACEALATKEQLILAGEISQSSITAAAREAKVRECLFSIGCFDPGFHWERVNIQQFFQEQAAELATSVALGKAGDQGIMFGYASDETPDFMPAPLYYAQQIMSVLREARKAGKLPELKADGKSQVTVSYGLVEGVLQPNKITTIVLSLQHHAGVSAQQIEKLALPYLQQVLPAALYDDQTKLFVNSAGSFIQGGPATDTGLTGRKIVVDTYGGWVPNGGGSFSGKDPSKVDRSGAYLARYLAKNLVASHLARRCEIQIAYGIALDAPVSLYVNTFGTGTVADQDLSKRIMEQIDFNPGAVIKRLRLDRPIYQETAWGGHFGRSSKAKDSFPWEKLDLPSLY